MVDLVSSKFVQLENCDKSSPPEKPTTVSLAFNIDQVINIDDKKNVSNYCTELIEETRKFLGIGTARTLNSEVERAKDNQGEKLQESAFFGGHWTFSSNWSK